MWSNDYRFLSIAREHIDSLTLDDVKSAVLDQMTTDSIEVGSHVLDLPFSKSLGDRTRS